MTIIGAVLGCVLLGAAAVGWALVRAPEGWEDTDGFHPGPRPGRAPAPEAAPAPANPGGTVPHDAAV
jgi:hypothetical protein